MSEIEAISLPVKYRPNSLSGLVGQKHIVNQIAGFYKQGRIPQSFLLLGNTGCGKTTTSRILAKLFACRNPDTKALKACGECTSCKLQNNPDIVEKNMATEGKVDDIRALVEGAGNRPMIGTKKVYVLDECFPSDTLLETSPGVLHTMQEVIDGAVSEILSYDPETDEFSMQPITARESKDAAEGSMVRVWLSDGSYQDCTDNHKWWSMTRNCMVRADELEPGEELLPLSSTGQPAAY